MDAISRGSTVFVCTGYGDSRMALHGFAGRVVEVKDDTYLIRDGRGEVISCCSRELQSINERFLPLVPGVADLKPPI